MTSNAVAVRSSTQTPVRSVAANLFESVFRDLVREPREVSQFSLGGRGGAYGAYGMPIYYLQCGKIIHAAGQYIDQLRAARPFTKNATELRCEALGLAVYVAGVPQIGGPDGTIPLKGVRVVVYDFDQRKPTLSVVVPSGEALAKSLHQIMVSTFNKVALESNVAGLQAGCLVLKSTAPGFPDTHLIQ